MSEPDYATIANTEFWISIDAAHAVNPLSQTWIAHKATQVVICYNNSSGTYNNYDTNEEAATAYAGILASFKGQ